MMASKPQRAAIYARISSDREGRELGVTRQIEDCTALAESLGWTLHPIRRVYKDNDRGASSLSRKPRPEYDELHAAVRAGQVDAIIFWSNSRLTRRPREYESVIELVEETGVRLAAVKSTQVDLTTASGRMVGRVLAAVDAAEAEQISERVQRRQQQRREEGKPHSTGTRPFGFGRTDTDENGKRKHFDTGTINKEEAAAIRAGAELITRGASLGDVVRAWTTGRAADEKGPAVKPVPPVTGGRWSRVTVRRALTRPRVAGLIEHHGVVVGTIGKDNDVPEPILSRQVWEDVRQKISDRSSEVRVRYQGREHLLSGLLTCGACGGPMKVSALRDPAGEVRADSFLSCIKENGGCGRVKRNLRLLEAFVLPAVEQRLAEAPPDADPDDDETAVERARLEAQRETIEAKIRDLRTVYTTTDLSAQDFVPMVRDLRTRKDEIEDALDALPGERRTDLGDDPLADWRSGTFDQRRELIESVIETVVVSPIGKVGPARARELVPARTTILWR